MKKIISMLLSVLIITAVFTALPITASAATPDSAEVGKDPVIEMPGGDFGTCSWSFDIFSGTLTVSGTGSTGDLSTEAKPWADHINEITEVVVMNGITTVGKGAFSNTPHLQKVGLAPSVTVIERDAFYKCPELSGVSLPPSIASIGIGAFLATGLNSITIPNMRCTLSEYSVGYREGKNFRLFPIDGFVIYGLSGSKAQAYANENGLGFVDLSSTPNYIYVQYGTAYNTATGEAVEEARPGERIRVVPDKMDRFLIFRSYYSDEVELDTTDWSFIMPDEGVGIYMDYDRADPLNLRLTEAYNPIDARTYEYLVQLIQNNELRGTLKTADANGHNEYYLSVSDDYEVLLAYDHISLYDYEYAPSYSVELYGNYELNPVNFIFAENEIYQGHVDLTVPAAGSPWDYYTMQADIVPTDEDWNTGRFTLINRIWYDHWGISAFTTFEGGEQYFPSFEVVPNDGYFLTLNTEMVIHVLGTDRDIHLMPQYMTEDGTARYSAGYEQIRIVGGEPHSISIANGYASLPSDPLTPVTQAVPGQYVYVHIDPNAVNDSKYVVMGSSKCSSDDVEVRESEMIDCWYFYMPNNDVSGTITFDDDWQQKKVVLPLYGGPVTIEGPSNQRSERFGVSTVINRKSADRDYDYETSTSVYDVDGNGTWDVQSVGSADKAVYSLLPTSSLTKNVTLTLTREESLHYPVRSVELRVEVPSTHKITVIGGVATTKRGDFANEFVIAEANTGDTVYVMPKTSDIDSEFYVVQFSMVGYSDDVDVIDDAVPSFTMPDQDVTVRLEYDCYPQYLTILDFRYSSTDELSADPPYQCSEAYGAYMVLRLMSADYDSDADGNQMFDIDGDGNWDVGRSADNKTFTLLAGHSLPETDVRLTLSREDSWTLPTRTLLIITHSDVPVAKRGDVNGDGEITIDDATLLQRFLAEYTDADGNPLLDLDDPITFSRCDANNDGKVNVRDITAIQRHLAGIELIEP